MSISGAFFYMMYNILRDKRRFKFVSATKITLRYATMRQSVKQYYFFKRGSSVLGGLLIRMDRGNKNKTPL